jgi:hypothetical protein
MNPAHSLTLVGWLPTMLGGPKGRGGLQSLAQPTATNSLSSLGQLARRGQARARSPHTHTVGWHACRQSIGGLEVA